MLRAIRCHVHTLLFAEPNDAQRPASVARLRRVELEAFVMHFLTFPQA